MKYEILSGIIDSEIGSNYYLLNIDSGKYLKLNTSGMCIYSFIKEGNDDEYIINQMIKNFNLNKDEATNDFNFFIHSALKLTLSNL